MQLMTWDSTSFRAAISCTSCCSVCCSRCLMSLSSVACDSDTAVGVAVSASVDTGCMVTSPCLLVMWASRNVRLMNAFGQCEHYNANNKQPTMSSWRICSPLKHCLTLNVYLQPTMSSWRICSLLKHRLTLNVYLQTHHEWLSECVGFNVRLDT